jgi:uncharacterized membrane protein YccF (DUF307 family)
VIEMIRNSLISLLKIMREGDGIVIFFTIFIFTGLVGVIVFDQIISIPKDSGRIKYSENELHPYGTTTTHTTTTTSMLDTHTLGGLITQAMSPIWVLLPLLILPLIILGLLPIGGR